MPLARSICRPWVIDFLACRTLSGALAAMALAVSSTAGSSSAAG
jgi:hypothetical protein